VITVTAEPRSSTYAGAMHEYSVAASLLRMAEEKAREAGARRVTRVEVRIGQSAGVDADLLRTAWDVVRGTPMCRDASLDIAPVPVRWVCALCRRPLAPGEVLRCPDCDVAAELDGGDELTLERIELERD